MEIHPVIRLCDFVPLQPAHAEIFFTSGQRLIDAGEEVVPFAWCVDVFILEDKGAAITFNYLEPTNVALHFVRGKFIP